MAKKPRAAEKAKEKAPYDGRWPFILIALVLAVAAVLTSGLLGRGDEGTPDLVEYNFVRAKVLSVDNSQLEEDPYVAGLMLGQQPIRVRLTSGPFSGGEFELTNTMSRNFNIHCRENMSLLLNLRSEDGVVTGLDVYGYSREGMMLGLALLFVLVLIVIGRKKGFYAIVSLAFTLAIVIFFMVPRILDGCSPILMAVLTAAVTTALGIFIISGWNKKSCAAIAGIIGGVVAAGVIALVAGWFGSLSGLNMSDAEEMLSMTRDIPLKIRELLFAGVIISALGAIMDVGMSISSAVFEVHGANRKLKAGELYSSGMNIGRDVMGTMANTLILAFAGSSITVVIIIILYNMPYLRLINLDLLGIEMLQGVCGSIGIVLTVPITAGCAAFLATRQPAKKDTTTKPAAGKSKG